MKPEFICKLPRHRTLSQLQKYYESKQYEGRADFFTGDNGKGEIVPLRERKPCVVYPLPKASVDQVVRFCFGEGKFPYLQVEKDEESGMPEAQALELEECLKSLIKHAKIRSVITSMMKRGLAEKTAVTIFSIKRGRICIEMPHAKDCWPTFVKNDPTGELESLTWCYQYEESVPDKDGLLETKRYWFRRDVTREAYLEYDRVEVVPGVPVVKWPEPKPTPHNFKCCPARWSRNLDDESEAGATDGMSLFENFLDECDALNFALSQRHRGITYWGTPQPYETGVEEGDGPEATGRTGGYSPSSGKSPHGAVSRKDARKLSPDNVWRYEGAQVTVGLLETTGKAFEVATLHVEDIRSRVLESMSVVLANADQFLKNGGDMNAKFLTLAYAPLLALVSELRDVTWWPELLAVLSICVRMIAADDGAGVVMPKAKKLAALAKKFEVQTPEGPVWMFPDITPIWGQFFEPSQDEIESAVRTATQAKDGGIVQEKTATKHVANHFGVSDVEEEVKATQGEAKKRADEAMKQAQASAKPAAPIKKKAKAA